MEDTLERVFAILIAVIIFFLLPLYIAFEKKDDISYSLALKVTSNFVNNVKNKGYMSKEMYTKFISDLAVSGNDYDVKFEHVAKKYTPVIYSYEDGYTKVRKKFDYNLYKDDFEKKEIINGGNTYTNLILTYDLSEERMTTDQILNTLEKDATESATISKVKPIFGKTTDEMATEKEYYHSIEKKNISYISGLYRLRLPDASGNIDFNSSGEPIYTMNRGDEFTVVVRNTNTTIATVLFNTLTLGANSGNITKVYINYGSSIQNESYRQTVLE